MRAFEDREHERVDDPDQGDDHGQGEQRVDQAEQLVHLAAVTVSNWAWVWIFRFG